MTDSPLMIETPWPRPEMLCGEVRMYLPGKVRYLVYSSEAKEHVLDGVPFPKEVTDEAAWLHLRMHEFRQASELKEEGQRLYDRFSAYNWETTDTGVRVVATGGLPPGHPHITCSKDSAEFIVWAKNNTPTLLGILGTYLKETWPTYMHEAMHASEPDSTELHADNHELRAKLKETEEELRKSNNQGQNLVKSNHALRMQLGSLQHVAEAGTAQTNNVAKELHKAREELRDAQNEIESLQEIISELKDANHEMRSLEEFMDEATPTLEGVRDALRILKDVFPKDPDDSLIKWAGDLAYRLRNLSHTNACCRENLYDKEAELRDAKENLESSEDVLRSLRENWSEVWYMLTGEDNRSVYGTSGIRELWERCSGASKHSDYVNIKHRFFQPPCVREEEEGS